MVGRWQHSLPQLYLVRAVRLWQMGVMNSKDLVVSLQLYSCR